MDARHTKHEVMCVYLHHLSTSLTHMKSCLLQLDGLAK